MAPTLDMVLGCYYLTMVKPGSKGEGKAFADFAEARLAYELGVIDLRAEVRVRNRLEDGDDELLTTSVGRVIFNDSINNCLRQAGREPNQEASQALVEQIRRELAAVSTLILA